uniref:alanine--tRNA ligase n=1 Tax=Romanomermis culicivorax TaxID=13658 RepID=A0A915ING6_ROMCU
NSSILKPFDFLILVDNIHFSKILDRFFVTYFGGCPEQNLDPDFETRDIWLRKIGLAENRVLSLPLADNFWEMGRSGPCGPCTEIFYFNLDIADVKKTTLDQCTEVWNLVFIQYHRDSDGNLHNLPKMHLDT